MLFSFFWSYLENIFVVSYLSFETLGRPVERLRKMIRLFSGRPGSGEFWTWKDDLMRAFVPSDLTSPLDQVTTILFSSQAMLSSIITA